MTDTLSEDPECTTCGYSLKGIVSTNCPECGADVSDAAQRYPSLAPSPWSASDPLPLWRGIWPVLWHPVRAIAAAESPQRVTTRRAVTFTLLVVVALVLAWPILSEVAVTIRIWIRDGEPFGYLGFFWREVFFQWRWYRLSEWEVWSLARWAIFFAVTCAVVVRSRRKWTRLLLFAPWIVVLEGLLLMAALLQVTVPEPSNLWVSGYGWWHSLTTWTAWRYWQFRMPLAMVPVAFVFLRAVATWRIRWAAIGALLLIPPAIYFSILWQELYVMSRL